MEQSIAKIFQHGGSQAVRLPKAFRLPGKTVRVTRLPNGILLEPDSDADQRAALFASLEGSCPDFPEIEQPAADPEREPLV
jgi:antitoxin VapB